MKLSSSQNDLQRLKGSGSSQLRSSQQQYNYMSTGKTSSASTMQPQQTVKSRVQTGRPAANSVDQPLILSNPTASAGGAGSL